MHIHLKISIHENAFDCATSITIIHKFILTAVSFVCLNNSDRPKCWQPATFTNQTFQIRNNKTKLYLCCANTWIVFGVMWMGSCTRASYIHGLLVAQWTLRGDNHCKLIIIIMETRHFRRHKMEQLWAESTSVLHTFVIDSSPNTWSAILLKFSTVEFELMRSVHRWHSLVDRYTYLCQICIVV